ncbi:PPE domain-containing protein [Actinophytocola oryzae]|uniref:PPE family protein n=1 Tax=Actinophytocola oryzae TaxID=502181 RepID=A0A4R7UTL8_9PSEU|nr:PPE domain-containing protein [Actinophytocola oryzae]TDV40003.1 PPE family protein [Actinophytocola oryzae]
MGHRWRGYEHPELYDMINEGPGAQASDPQTTYWQNLATELTQVDEELNSKLTSLGSRWEGKAAESAQTGLTPLASWASDAETGASVMKVSSEDQGQFVSDARASMPEPVPVTTPAPSGWDVAAAAGAALLGNPGPALDVANQANDHEAEEAAKNEAEQKAVETMQTYESSSTWNRTTLGTFVPPPDVVVSTPAPQGSATGVIFGAPTVRAVSGDNSGGTKPGGKSNTGGPGGSVPPPNVNGGQGNGNGNGGNGGGNGGGGDGQVQPPNVRPGEPGTTTPSDVLTPLPTNPGNGPLPTPGPGPNPLPPNPNPNPFPPGGGGPFPPFGGGDPSNAGDIARRPLPPLKPGLLPVESTPFGRPGGPGGLPGGTPGGPGGFGAFDGERAPSQIGRGGVLGGAPGEGGVVRSGPGAAGAAGARGANGVHGPVGAGGRRADGEEDDEHYSPDYLLEEDDVFGDDRRVSPTVIGE